MAQYCTRAQFASYGLPASRWAGRETMVDAALTGVSDTVDGYLRVARYRLPLSSWGEDLARAVAEVAALTVLTTIGFNPGNGADEVVRERAAAAEERLRQIGPRQWLPNVVDGDAAREPFTRPLPVSDAPAGY